MSAEPHPFRAGFRTLAVPWGAGGGSFPLLVLYPTHTPGVATPFGHVALELSADAGIAPGPHRLAVVSHGGGGAPLLYAAVAAHLARHGWTVALPEHPGNNRHDNHLQGTAQNLVDRPLHVRLGIDSIAADADLGAHTDTMRVAVIGHSMGGYTALAAAGGQPTMPTGEAVAVTSDPRVAALVLMAPAAAWFGAPSALAAVRVPILLLQAEHDPVTPAWQGQLVQQGVADPALVRSRTVAGAGHFSFLTPFPRAMQRPGFAPANDPPGFDRAAFLQELPLEVSGFLDDAMPLHAATRAPATCAR